MWRDLDGLHGPMHCAHRVLMARRRVDGDDSRRDGDSNVLSGHHVRRGSQFAMPKLPQESSDMSNTSELKGRTTIVTGAGRGLGRAIALELAAAGANVVLAARSRDQIEAVAREIEANGASALAVPADVNAADSVQNLVDSALAEFGELHVLVNNSGIYADIPILDTTDADWDRVIGTNLRGTFLCSRAAGRVFAKEGRGRIINIASNLGIIGRSGFAAYCASKAAIIQFTKVAALEWARFGVQVNAIAPGYFETELNAQLRADEAAAARVVRRIPARRMGRPEELAPLCVFLASDAAGFMTGETIVLDGGESIR